MPPVQASYLPPSGSLLEARLDAVQGGDRPRSPGGSRGGFLDFRVDGPEVHGSDNFFDRVHYKNPLAREIEDQITAVLRRSSSASR